MVNASRAHVSRSDDTVGATPTAAWKAVTAALVAGPYDPSGVTTWPCARSRYWMPDTADDTAPDPAVLHGLVFMDPPPSSIGRCQKESIPLTRACQVTGPTIPSTTTVAMSVCRACWKPRTAASVSGPKLPSTASP